MCVQDIALSQKTTTRITTVIAETGKNLIIPPDIRRVWISLVDNNSAPMLLAVIDDARVNFVPLADFDGSVSYIRPLTVHSHPGIIHGELLSADTGSGNTWTLVEVILQQDADLAVQAAL